MPEYGDPLINSTTNDAEYAYIVHKSVPVELLSICVDFAKQQTFVCNIFATVHPSIYQQHHQVDSSLCRSARKIIHAPINVRNLSCLFIRQRWLFIIATTRQARRGRACLLEKVIQMSRLLANWRTTTTFGENAIPSTLAIIAATPTTALQTEMGFFCDLGFLCS